MEIFALILYLTKWLVLVAPVGLIVGSCCAGFLWSLEAVTQLFWQQPWLLYLLPAAGVGIGLLYHLLGRSVEAGSNLIVDEIHEPGAGVPVRIVPLVFLGTIVTHLFGGSAGREGTALQIGGGVASAWGACIPGLNRSERSTLLMAGVAAGFGGVFGTPFAGTIFAMEVLAIGRLSYGAVLPCLCAAVLSDWACAQWGVAHSHYTIASAIEPAGIALLAKVAIGGACFGLAAHLFSWSAHALQRFIAARIERAYLRPVVGGIAVIGLVYLTGTREYLGLGVAAPRSDMTSIISAFSLGGADPFSWAWKILFTVVTIASGFKGGEVTPLFFIGATLGNTLGPILGVPVDFMAGLGFVAVFAAAANTPLACTVMAIELFGGAHILYFATACFVAYSFSGHAGIYHAQQVGEGKAGRRSRANNQAGSGR